MEYRYGLGLGWPILVDQCNNTVTCETVTFILYALCKTYRNFVSIVMYVGKIWNQSENVYGSCNNSLY